MTTRTDYQDLICSTKDGVLLVEINRPEKRNAMRLSLRQELIDCMYAAEADDAVKAIVITGVGDRAFSAGADLAELQTRTVESELSRAAILRRRLPETAETCSKPIVAAINGACIGAGLEFALGCPIRISSRTATFGMPEVALGVPPGSGGTQRLTRAVGQAWSMHLTLTGETISAEHAFRIGLVTALYEPDELREQAIVLAAKLGDQPTVAYQSARDAINRAFDLDLASGIDLERKLFALCLSTGIPQQKAHDLLERLSRRSRDREAARAGRSPSA
jgi:enoyl-CoA hydratase